MHALILLFSDDTAMSFFFLFFFSQFWQQFLPLSLLDLDREKCRFDPV